MKNQEEVLSQEVAREEVLNFLNEHTINLVNMEDVQNDFPATVRAVMKGKLVFTEGVPVFELTSPIKNDEGDITLKEVNFRTRILPREMSMLSRGLNIQKEAFEFSLKCTAFIIQQPKGMLDRFSKFDYKVIQELTPVFM